MLCLVIRTSYLNLIPGYRKEFPKIVKQGPWRGPDQIGGFQQDLHNSFWQEPYTRSCKDLLEEFTRISTRASLKDFTSGAGIWKRVHAPQNLGLHFVWASAIEMHMDMLTRASFYARIYNKMPGPDGAPWCNPGLNTYRKSPGRVDTPESIASEWVDVGISSNWPSWEVTCRQRPGKGIGHLRHGKRPFYRFDIFCWFNSIQ